MNKINQLVLKILEACIGKGVLTYFLRDTGIFVFFFFILGYGIFRNFGIWDIGIYFGIRVKLILGYGIFWTVYFGIWDIAYPTKQASYCDRNPFFSF